MREGSIRVKMNAAVLAAILAGTGKTYISVKEASKLLGVSTKSAGKILARLEEEGYLIRWSKRTYKVVVKREQVSRAAVKVMG